MDARCKALANAVGKHVVDREFADLLDLFAPWLGADFSAADLEDMIDASNDGLPPPATFEVDEGMVDFEELSTPSDFGPPTRPLPTQITAANFKGWISVQFAPDPKHHEECNVCFDVWMAFVEHEGELLVGYFEAAEAD
jgi:hypothetical protein